MLSEDHLSENVALEWLQVEKRIRLIDRRSNVVIGIAFTVLASFLPLGFLGVSNYDAWSPIPDQRWADRICMFAGWMVPAGMFAWSLGKFRVIQSQLFLNPKPLRWLPWIAGLAGCVAFTCALREWFDKPFSGETLRSNDAWKFGVAWALLGWAYVFRR
jgi:hypothetical protein